MNCRNCWIAAAALATWTHAAQAQSVGVTLKLLEYDVAKPNLENYLGVSLPDGLIDSAIATAWKQLSGVALDPVKNWLSAANRLGHGMTARDITIRLGTPAAAQLESTGQSKGRITIVIVGNSIDLTSTHPVSQGTWMDPKLRVVFDMALLIDFYMADQAPYVKATTALLQPGSVTVLPTNLSAALGLSIDDIISSLGGARSVVEKVRSAFSSAHIPLTNSFNAQMAGQAKQLSVPNGYTYNGGRVEPNRIIVAGYKVKAATGTKVAVVASWPKALGTLMDDCRPVGIGARWQSGPKPFSGVSDPPSATAQVLNINFRSELGAGYNCSAVLAVPQGAPLNLTWAYPVGVTVASPNPMALKTVLVARPAGWLNPVTPNDRDFTLVLAKESGAGTGAQLNARAIAHKNPLDPVAHAGPTDRINPQLHVFEQIGKPAAKVTAPASTNAQMRAMPQSSFQNKADAVSLNPQPLPPATLTPAQAPSALR